MAETILKMCEDYDKAYCTNNLDPSSASQQSSVNHSEKSSFTVFSR